MLFQKGVINRAILFEKLSQALIAIGDVLPRMDLSADLYKTEYMEATLSRLYTHIIRFLRRCVQWYNKSPIGRLCSAITSPFELVYQDLVEQVQLCSKLVDDLASAGARAEIRRIRTLTERNHTEIIGLNLKLLEGQKSIEAKVVQMLQVASSTKSITERVSDKVCSIRTSGYRLELHGVIQSLKPDVLPDMALLKVQSFVRRDLVPSLPSPDEQEVRNTIMDWALGKSRSLLVVQVGLRAQKQAKELATNVIEHLRLSGQCVFWNLSSNLAPPCAHTLTNLFKGIIFQALQSSSNAFSSFAEQLNLSKIHDPHTEREWADLICMLFTKLPTAFVIIETDGLRVSDPYDPDWSKRLFEHVQYIVDRSIAAGCDLKLLLILYGNSHRCCATATSSQNVRIATLRPPVLVPPRLRHVVCRSNSFAKDWKMPRPKGRL